MPVLEHGKPGRKPAVNAESIRDWFIHAPIADARGLLSRIVDVVDIRIKMDAKPEAPDAN